MHESFFDRQIVSLKLMSKSWQPCSFNKVPYYPETSNYFRVQETGMSEYYQGFTPTQDVS